MDARELTNKFYELSAWKYEAEKRIEFLEQENQKLRRLTDDMKIDLKMLEQSIRRREH